MSIFLSLAGIMMADSYVQLRSLSGKEGGGARRLLMRKGGGEGEKELRGTEDGMSQ